MSADNGILVKQMIDGTWWVNYGFASDDTYGDDEWFADGKSYPTKAEALEAAHNLEDELGYVEYGVAIL